MIGVVNGLAVWQSTVTLDPSVDNLPLRLSGRPHPIVTRLESKLKLGSCPVIEHDDSSVAKSSSHRHDSPVC